jgi:hypothetical protein
MPPPDFYLKAGDGASAISAVLTDDDGTAVSISGATVRFHMAPISGATAPLIDAAATNLQSGTTANIGQVEYDWAAGDTDTAGLYLAEWEVVFASGATQTYPNSGYALVQISDGLA